MTEIRSVCVYCGSGPGTDPAFVAAARAFGKILAENRVRLVYGGGSLGLMGAVATSVLDHGGEVTGIIPEFLTGKERKLTRAQEVIVTDDMHERKQIMFERADAFVALPGGVGTLEELVEQMTWAQLGRHHKPILIANIEGFWDPLCALLDHMKTLGFIRPDLAIDPLVAERVEDILPKLRDFCEGCAREERGRAGHHRAAVRPGLRRRTSATSLEGTWPAPLSRGLQPLPQDDGSDAQKRHRLDPVAVGIADEGRIITALAVMRPQARRAVAGAARRKRRSVEGIHGL